MDVVVIRAVSGILKTKSFCCSKIKKKGVYVVWSGA